MSTSCLPLNPIMRHIHILKSVRETVYMRYNFVTTQHKRQFFAERLRYGSSAETQNLYAKLKTIARYKQL